MGLAEAVFGIPIMETVRYNLWATTPIVSTPVQLVGRVDGATWSDFCNSISILGATQPNCCMQCAQCLTCNCGEAEARMAAGLLEIESAFGARLGATAFNRMTYQYQTWVEATPGSPGDPNANPPVAATPGTPAHWENRSLDILRIDFAQPFVMSVLPMQIVGGQPMQGAPMGMAPMGQQMGQPQFQPQMGQPQMMQPQMMQPQFQGQQMGQPQMMQPQMMQPQYGSQPQMQYQQNQMMR